MAENFGDVQIYTGQPEPFNGGGQEFTPAQVHAPTAAASIDQSRAIAEVQAALVIARANPRDENAGYLRIIKSCKRRSLAESATYAFKRGGTLVTGPSIRLAEVMARCWGNMNYGFREIGRAGDYSEVEAFAWDLETNTKATRQFQVRHYRDKKSGAVALEAERDKYEHIASQAQRRVRACILELIPGDIVEAAETECDRTLKAGDGRPLEDRIRDMAAAFDEIGVSTEDLESYLGHKLKSVAESEFVRLKKIYRSIKDGVADPREFFNQQQSKEAPKAKSEPKETRNQPDEKFALNGNSTPPEPKPWKPGTALVNRIRSLGLIPKDETKKLVKAFEAEGKTTSDQVEPLIAEAMAMKDEQFAGWLHKMTNGGM